MQGVHQREPLASGEATSQVGRISAQILSPVSLVSIDLFCVSVCRCVRVVHICVCAGARACVWRPKDNLGGCFLGAVTSDFETGSLIRTWGSLIRLGLSGQQAPGNNL